MKFMLVLSLLALSAVPFHPPPESCRVQVQQLGHDAPLNQVLIDVRVPITCPLEGKATIRFRTVGGGILPPMGYTVLRGSYPRHLTYWLRRGGIVEQKFNRQFVAVWRISE